MTAVIEVGSIVEGKVLRIKPFGAIVLLPNNAQGLVHISHISAEFVQNIEDHVKIGDIVKVKVLTSDATTGKISLSIKDTLPPIPKREFHAEKSQKNDISPVSFEDKLKEWSKLSNERHASLNKRNKRR